MWNFIYKYRHRWENFRRNISKSIIHSFPESGIRAAILIILKGRNARESFIIKYLPISSSGIILMPLYIEAFGKMPQAVWRRMYVIEDKVQWALMRQPHNEMASSIFEHCACLISQMWPSLEHQLLAAGGRPSHGPHEYRRLHVLQDASTLTSILMLGTIILYHLSISAMTRSI